MTSILRRSYVLSVAISITLVSSSIDITLASDQPDISQRTASSRGFLENKGQILGSDGQPVPFVFFKTSTPNLNMYITEKGISYIFLKYEEFEDEHGERGNYPNRKSVDGEFLTLRMDVQLLGATINKDNISKEQTLQGEYNFYLSHCPNGILGVKEFQQITIKEVYPGIDWVIYRKDALIKYDFVVHPGANPYQIQLRYIGDGDVITNHNKQITIKSEYGNIEEAELYCYNSSNNKTINANYNVIRTEAFPYDDRNSSFLLNNSKSCTDISFELPEGYVQDPNSDLIIDPQLTWASYFGNTDNDGPIRIQADANNNLYLGGYNQGANFPLQTLTGAYNDATFNGGGNDCFITKFDPNGILLWSTFVGGSLNDKPWDMNINGNNEVYMVGYTESGNFPIQNKVGAYNQAMSGTEDCFVVKFDANGALNWSSFLGGTDYEEAKALAIDASNNVYVTGFTISTNYPTLAATGAYNQATFNGGFIDIFLSKFNSNDTLVWSTYLGGTADEEPWNLDIDNNQNLYLIGYSQSANYPTLALAGAYNNAVRSGGQDGIITKFNSDAMVWSSYLGSAGMSTQKITFDNNDNVYITGQVASTLSAINLPGAYNDNTNNGGTDAFVLKFNAANAMQWATYVGGSGTDRGFGIKTNSRNELFVSGTTGSANFPVQFLQGSYNDLVKKGTEDAFLLKFSEAGELCWGTFYGSNFSSNWFGSIYINSTDDIFATGEWLGNGANLLNPGAGAFYQGQGGSHDGLVVKFIDTTYVVAKYDTVAICAGDSTLINGTYYKTSGTYLDTFRLCYDSVLYSTVNVNTLLSTIYAPTICTGDSLFAQGAFQKTTGTYRDTLTSITSGCDSIIQTDLTVNPLPIFNQALPSCDSILFNTVWYYVNQIVTDTIPAGSYLGCDSITNTSIMINSSTTNSITANFCGTYTSPSGKTFNTSGLHLDTIPTASGCDSVFYITLSGGAVVVNINQGSFCDSAYVNGSWYFSTQSINDTIVNGSALGCDSISIISFTIAPTVVSNSNVSICEGDSILIANAWRTTSGNYPDTLQGASFAGCDSIIVTALAVTPLPTVSIVPDKDTLIKGETIILNANGATSYVWNDGSSAGSISISPVITTTYCVTGVVLNGCIDSTCIVIEVSAYECDGGTIFIPNAFSPNGDGANDLWKIYGAQCIKSATVSIYDRWGKQVYASTDINDVWDGTLNGKSLDTGVFIYKVNALLNDETTQLFVGNVSLVR